MKNCGNFQCESEKLREELQQHAFSAPHREVCGFIYKDFYIRLRNLAEDDRSFYADPSDVAFALAHYGEPLAIFHTHPDGPTTPSMTDLYLSYYFSSTMIIGVPDEGNNLVLAEYQ